MPRNINPNNGRFEKREGGNPDGGLQPPVGVGERGWHFQRGRATVRVSIRSSRTGEAPSTVSTNGRASQHQVEFFLQSMVQSVSLLRFDPQKSEGDDVAGKLFLIRFAGE